MQSIYAVIFTKFEQYCEIASHNEMAAADQRDEIIRFNNGGKEWQKTEEGFMVD